MWRALSRLQRRTLCTTSTAALTQLIAHSRTGKYQAAMGLLAQMQQSPKGAPREAYHLALRACRLRQRTWEGYQLLQRMGTDADTAAHNECLHGFRNASDYEGASVVWSQLSAGVDATLSPDADSFNHMLQLCAATGRGHVALRLLDEMMASRAVREEPRHLLAALRACTRGKLWAEAARLLRTLDAPALAATLEAGDDGTASRLALRACAHTGDHGLAARIVVEALGPSARAEHFAGWLRACRRAADADAAREAMVACRAGAAAAGAGERWGDDETCHALLVGALLEAAAAVAPRTADGCGAVEVTDAGMAAPASEEAVAAAAKAAAAVELAAEAARAAAAAPGTDAAAAAAKEVTRVLEVALARREAAVAVPLMALRHRCGVRQWGHRNANLRAYHDAQGAVRSDGRQIHEQGVLTPGLQVAVLRLCAERREWRLLKGEAAAARGRGYGAAVFAERNLAALEEACRLTDEAAAAMAEAAAEAPSEARQEAAEAAAELRVLAGEASVATPPAAPPQPEGAAARPPRPVRAAGAAAWERRRGALPQWRVVWEDEALLAVLKPIGIRSDRGARRGLCMQHLVAAAYSPQQQLLQQQMTAAAETGAALASAMDVAGVSGGATRAGAPLLLHRLDAPTSGLLLFAKSLHAAAHVSEQFRRRQVRKSYLAVLLGSPSEDAFEVDVPIATDPLDPQLSVASVASPTSAASVASTPSTTSTTSTTQPGAGEVPLPRHHRPVPTDAPRDAHTSFEVVARGADGAATLCRASPLTGRKHQIRVHAQHAGHAVAGDTSYGAAQQLSAPARCGRLLLHAHTLQLSHPIDGRQLRLAAAPPDDFWAEAAALGVDAEAARRAVEGDDVAQEGAFRWVD